MTDIVDLEPTADGQTATPSSFFDTSIRLGSQPTNTRVAWLVFADLGIPQGATINSITLDIKQNDATGTIAIQTNISVADADDQAIPTTFANVSGAAKTTPVDWDFNSPGNGNYVTTIDFKAAAQPAIDRAGWSESSNLVVYITGEGTNSILCYDNSAAVGNRPLLNVSYTDGGGGTILKQIHYHRQAS